MASKKDAEEYRNDRKNSCCAGGDLPPPSLPGVCWEGWIAEKLCHSVSAGLARNLPSRLLGKSFQQRRCATRAWWFWARLLATGCGWPLCTMEAGLWEATCCEQPGDPGHRGQAAEGRLPAVSPWCPPQTTRHVVPAGKTHFKGPDPFR